MRKLGGLLGMVLLLSLSAAAQETPKSEVFLGYSLLHFNPSGAGFSSFNLNGGTGSFTFNPSRTPGGGPEFMRSPPPNPGTKGFYYPFGPPHPFPSLGRAIPLR